jgi:hypothetical protein
MYMHTVAAATGTRYCGGALISAHYVVTAASCIYLNGDALAGSVAIGGMSEADPNAHVRTPQYLCLFHALRTHCMWSCVTVRVLLAMNSFTCADMHVWWRVSVRVRPTSANSHGAVR